MSASSPTRFERWLGNASGWGGPDIVLFVPGQGLYMMAKLGAQLAGGCA